MNFRGSSLIRGIVSLAGKIFGSDSEDEAGVGPFKLPDGHPFHRAGSVHDFYFTAVKSGDETMSLEDADIQLFTMFYLLAKNAPSKKERVELLMDCCAYWPWARKVGQFLWKGPIEDER